jgi:S1-C subfamily serine protease
VPVASLGDGTGLRVGALVLALGRPGGAVTASLGVISTVGGEWRTWHGGSIDRFVRLDLSIYDGFSGGPLVDAADGCLGSTHPASRAAPRWRSGLHGEPVVDQLVKSGRVARGYLGLGMQAVRLPQPLVERLSLPTDVGLMVVSAEPSGPGDTAGILIGDVLIAIADRPVGDPAEVLSLWAAIRSARPLATRIIRAGEPKYVSITIGERPRDPLSRVSRVTACTEGEMIDSLDGPLGEHSRRWRQRCGAASWRCATRGAGAGSGIIWSANGLIVTNAHVARSEHATVVLWDGRDARRHGYGTRPAARSGDDRDRSRQRQVDRGCNDRPPTDLRTGDVVVALGHPWGITGAIALGIVHAVETRRGAPRWIRADIRLAPGQLRRSAGGRARARCRESTR